MVDKRPNPHCFYCLRTTTRRWRCCSPTPALMEAAHYYTARGAGQLEWYVEQPGALAEGMTK